MPNVETPVPPQPVPHRGDPPLRLLHPALASGPAWATGRAPELARGLSPLNLRDERGILRFALALFSALAFLEREGWPLLPAPCDWAIDAEGLPRLTEPSGAAAPSAGRAHGALVYRLLTGKAAPESGPWPSAWRRGRASQNWAPWFSELSESGEVQSASCRDLLGKLWGLAQERPARPELPASWGIGVVWEPPGELWSGGWHEVSAPSPALLDGLLSVAVSPLGGIPPLVPVFLGTPPPYPLASLEPLLTSLLGGEYAARAWMAARLPAGTLGVSRDLRGLLEDSACGGWVLWPCSALDAESRAVLVRCAKGLPKRLWALEEGEDGPQGAIPRCHMLWLPQTAEEWYREHCEALLGPDPKCWLGPLQDLPPDQPRPGTPLFPPTPQGLLTPHRPWAGSGPEPRRALPAVHGSHPTPEAAIEDCARRAELATLLLAARSLRRKGQEALGAFWEGTAFLLMGQSPIALAAWEACEGNAVPAASLALARARALERLQDYPGILRQIQLAERAGLAPAESEQAQLLKGQAQWLCGKPGEARATLKGVLERAREPETRAQALCHLAVLALHSNRVDDALARVEEARRCALREASPFTHFLLAHRRGMVYQKMGDFGKALDLFSQAKRAVASAGLRVHEAGCEADCGNALRRLCRFEEAAACYRRCAEGALCLGLDALARTARFNLALCSLEAGDVLGAKRVFEEAAAASGSLKNPVYQAIDCYWLGVASQQLGEYPSALEWAERGLSLPDELCDPEVRPSLLLLRGEVLLLSGQGRKLANVLKELERTLTPRSDPDDRLAALALRCAVSRRGDGPEEEACQREAQALLPSCSPYFRAHWQLLSAGDEDALLRAWQAAREARSAYLACRALAELAGRGALPRLCQEDRRWLLEHLTRNRLRGPERVLLPLLDEPAARPAREEARSPDLLAFLASAEGSAAETEGEILARSGAQAACLLNPGQPPRHWGECGADPRRALLAAAGTKGELRAPGGWIFGALGEEGLWCGFFKAGSEGFAREARTLLALWTRLLPHLETPPVPPPPTHPAMGRFLITRSPAMSPVLEDLQRAAAFGFPVLLTGEAGVGKEACARALHAASGRARKEWMPFNCANLTPTLAASQLFGHRRGAFTGADRDHAGLVEAARDSTLFMDEVGELPLEVQPHLLRFLQDGSFMPLGEVRPRVSNARIVAATNRNLEQAVSEGRFREDLFHRLNVLPIRIPPLRERPEDIHPLFEHFLTEAARTEGLEAPRADADALACLAAYPWPGNVRELQNAARAALVASHPDPVVRARHLPGRILKRAVPPGGDKTLAARLRETERAILGEALRESGGNLSAAARALGLTRQGLFAKLKRHGMR